MRGVPRRSCSSPRVRLKLIVQLQSHYALDGLDLVQDRGSGSGRDSVASVCNAIVASINGIESETVIRSHKFFPFVCNGGLNGMRPTSKDGRRLIYIAIIYI